VKKYTVREYLWGEIKNLQKVTIKVIELIDKKTSEQIKQEKKIGVLDLVKEILPELDDLKEILIQHGVVEEITKEEFAQMTYIEFYDLYDLVMEKNGDFFIRHILASNNLVLAISSGSRLQTSISLLKSISDSPGGKSKKN
jgi:hypothetical protein